MSAERHDGGAPPLVDPSWVREHRDAVVVLQVDDDSAAYYEAHLPGARPVATYDDLHEQVRRGPVDQGHFEQLMQRLGVRTSDHVVLLSASPAGPDGDGSHAAFAFWLMRLYGHRRLSLLDGGLPAWLLGGGAAQQSAPEVPPVGRYHSPGRDPWLLLGRDELLARYVERDDTVLLDCRTPGEYEGRARHRLDLAVERHRVSGHVPGARNLPSVQVLEGGRFRGAGELTSLFGTRGVDAGSDVAVYCRVAERSATLWFALAEVLGHPRVRHYVGGWAEYGSLVDVPVTRE